MKKLNLLFTMLMLMCFSMGSWAADELKATLLFDGTTDWGIPTSGTNTSAAQFSDGTYTITLAASTNYKQNSGYLILGKSGSTLTLPAFSWKTTKIAVTGSASASTSVKQNIFVGDVAVSTETTGAQNVTNTYTINSSYQDAGNVYVLKVTSAHNTQITKIEIYGESSSTSPSISIVQNGSAITAVDFGEVPTRETDLDGDYGATQTINVKASNLTGDVLLEIEDPSAGQYFSIYDPRYAAAYFKEYTLKQKNGAIDTSLVLDANAWNSTGVMEGKLKVSSKVASPDFNAFNIDLKITVFEIEAGDYDINLNNTFFGLASTGANPNEQTGSYKGITVVAGCESTASSKTYYDAAHVRFYGGSFLKISAPAGYVVDTIRFTAGGTWNGGISANVGTYDDSKKEWSGSASCVLFNFSLQDRISKVMVSFKEAPTVGLPTISGQTPFYPSTTVTMSIETEGADIIYTTDGEDPLGGDNTYTQPITITETKTFKARGFKGVNLGDVVTKTFTKATPISVADAIELIPDAGNTKNDQFVVGYVCTASESEPSNGQMTYYISDNASTVDEGTATTDRIQIYKGKGLNNADFTAASDLAVGDKVVVYGQLKNYNGTYEFNSGNYIVEYTKRELKAVGVSGSLTQTEYDYGDQLNVAGLTATAYYTVGANVDVTNDPSLVWTKEGKSLSESLVYGGNSFVQASFGGKTSSTFNITTTIKTYALTFSAPSNGTLVIKDALGNEKSSGDKFWKNEPLTVFATPSTGYKLDKVTVLKASDDSDITSEVLNGKDLKMPNYAIKVSASFAKKAEGVLTLSKNVVDFGASKVGSSIASQSFKLSGTGFTPNGTISLAFAGDNKDYFGLIKDSYTADANGAIGEKNVEILVDETAYATYGVRDCQLKISSDDLASDSIVTIKLHVGAVITITPAEPDLAFGEVLKGDDESKYKKTFHLNVTNMDPNCQISIDPYAGFKVEGSYWCTPNAQGVIDVDLTFTPNTSSSLGVISGPLQFFSAGSPLQFKSPMVVATMSMTIIASTAITVPDITGGSLSWDGGAAPVVAKPGSEHTLLAVPASGYTGGEIAILKAEDDSDVTDDVMSGSTLTVPSYAIKIVVSGFEAQAHPSGLGWRYSGADVTTHAHTFGASTERFYFPSLKNPNEIDLNDIEFISSDSTVAEFGTRSHENSSWFAAVWVKKAGTAIMTARLKNHATYDDIEVSYTLTVSKGELAANQFRWFQYPDIYDPESDTYTWYESHSWPYISASSTYVDKNTEVTYESTNTDVATISSTGTITPVANGSTVIKAKFIGNDMFNAKTVQFTLKVQKASPVLSWSTAPTTANTTVDMADNYGIYTFPRFGSVSPNVEALRDLVVISSSDPTVAEINSNGYVNPLAEGQTTIKLSLAATDKSNAAEELSYTFTVTDSRPTLTIVAGDHGTYQVKDNSGTYVIESGAKVKANTSLYLVSQSAETGYKNTPVYKVVKTADNTDVTAAAINGSYLKMQAFDITISATYPEKAVAPIGWSSTETQYAYTDDRAYTLPTLVNAGLSITFASSNTNVATISYDGKVSVWSAGTTNISVSYAGDGTYKQTTVSYELVVRSPNHLNVTGDLTKKSYDYGDAINCTGMTATLYYTEDNSDGVDVTDVANWFSTPATVTTGYTNAKITAAYKGIEGYKNVDVFMKQYTVSFSKPTHGTIVVKQNGNAISTGDQFPKGTVLTVEATPDAGYALATLTANGEDIMSSKQITIGTTEVTIAATFKQGPSLVSNTYSIDFGEAIINTTDASNRPYLSSTFILTGSNLTGDIRLEATTNSGGSTFSVDWKTVKEYSPVDGAFYLTIPTQMATGWIGDFYGKITISSKANPADFEPVVINLHGKITDKHEAGLSWGVSEYNLYPVGPASTTRPELSNPNNLNVTYSSSNPAVATVSEGGWVSVVASGDAVITASYAGNDTYKAGEASYTVHVHKANSIQIKGGLQKTYGYEAGDQLDFTGLIAKLKYDGDDNTYQLGAEVEWSADPISVNMLPNQCGLTVTASAYGVSGTREVSVTVNLHAVTFTNPQYGYLSIKKGDSWISSGESFPKGTELTVVANPIDGYELNSITINGEVLEGNTFTVGAEAMEVVVTFKPKSDTGIDQVELEQQIRKEFRDGKLYILRGGKTYDAAGRLVK